MQIIKPKSPAPPANKLPAYLLYILSFVSFIVCLVFFILYPCCCGSRKLKGGPLTEGPGGMMVLPIQGLPGAQPKKKGKKGKGSEPGNVQVNLIVDPTMFGRDPERGQDEEEDEEDDSTVIPGSYSGSSGAGQRRRRPKRRGIFAGLALEAQWKRARKLLKWQVTVDAIGMVAWGAVFVLVLLGKRCPVGGYLGWCVGHFFVPRASRSLELCRCDAYNFATAAACFLCLAFGLSIFFDVKDLSASRASPRTRT